MRYSWIVPTGVFSGYLKNVDFKLTGDDGLAICDFYINYENMENGEAFWLDAPCESESNGPCGVEEYATQLIVCKFQKI